MQYTDDDQANEGNQCAAQAADISAGNAPLGKIHEADQGGFVAYHKTAVLQTDDGDKQADTWSNGIDDSFGNGADDGLTQSDFGDDNKKDTGNKHYRERLGIGIAHGQYDSVGKKSVQAHAGCLDEGDFGIQCAENGSYKRSDAGADEHAVRNLGRHIHVAHDLVRVG